MKSWQSWLQFGNLLLLGVTAWVLIDGMPRLFHWRAARDARPLPRPQAFDWVDPSKGVGIIQFYAYPGAVPRGAATSVCYGVMNATTVKLDPPVAEAAVTLNRCFELRPTRTARYTLTAADAAGHTASKSIEIAVLPASP